MKRMRNEYDFIADVICFLLTNKIKQDEKSKSRNTTRTKRNID